MGSFDDLEGLPCREGTELVGVVAITWSPAPANLATITCVPTTLHELTVTLDGPGTGTVTSSPAGVSCDSDCTQGYTPATRVTLTAVPADGSGFAEWGGACSGMAATCTVTMDQANSVTASFFQFATIQLTVTTIADDDPFTYAGWNSVEGSIWPCMQFGGGSTTCWFQARAGTPFALLAASSEGDTFVGWDGLCDGPRTERECWITAPAGTSSLTATFRES